MNREANIPYDEGMGSSELTNAEDRLREAGSKFKDRASQMAGTAAEAINRQRANAANLLDRAASTVHNGVDSAASVGQGVESGMRSTASYIRENDFRTMGSDLMGVCRRHPTQSLISAAVVGFLVGQFLRRGD